MNQHQTQNSHSGHHQNSLPDPGSPAAVGVGCAWVARALTVGAVDAGVLVVAEEKATMALTLVAAQGVDTDLLAATIVVLALVHVCRRGREGQR